MTHKKIAQLANVSVSTVSKALSSSNEISEELREKIIKIAIECGYFAEKGRRKIEYTKDKAITIAILCPEIISIAYAGEITAIKNELESRGAVAAIYVYDFNSEKLNNIIKAITIGNRADGIILFESNERVSAGSIPLVGIGRSNSDYDTISFNADDCFFEIVEYLKNLGHEDIAFVGETHTHSKFEAYKKALEANGIAFKEENAYIINERFEEIGYIAGEKLLQRKALPTAAICAYDEIALALIRRLSEKGIKIPQQISVVGINNVPMSAYSLIPLTTVKIFEKEQAEIAVELLYDKIFKKSEVIQHITVKHTLLKRETTGKRR